MVRIMGDTIDDETPPHSTTRFAIHYDGPDGKLRLSTFVAGATAVDEIIQCIAKDISQQPLSARVYLKESENACFLQIFTIFVVTSVGASVLVKTLNELIKLNESKSFKVFMERLTGKDFDSSAAPKYIADLIKAFLSAIIHTPNKTLKNFPVSRRALNRLTLAKSNLFAAAKQDPDLIGLGVGDDPTFRIPKDEFDRHTEVYPDETNHPPLFLDVRALVVSPVLIEGAGVNQWHLKVISVNEEPNSEKLAVYIEDQNFIDQFKLGNCLLRQEPAPNEIRALVEVEQLEKDSSILSRGHKITKVYHFNDVCLAEPEDDDFSSVVVIEPDLFSQVRNRSNSQGGRETD